MDIICISDISWEHPDISILDCLRAEIEEINPDLVLFAGDIINDGGNKEEHVEEFVEVLNYLEKRDLPSFTIEGNHDEYSNYGAVEEEISTLEYAEEISEEVVEFNGLKFVGIPFSYTTRLRNARGIGDDFPGSYDLVLSHAEGSRRIWLSELDAKFIVTGHYAEFVCRVNNQVFVSMQSFPTDSVKIDTEDDSVTYRRITGYLFDDLERYPVKAVLEDGGLNWDFDETDPDLPLGIDRLKDGTFASRVEALISARKEVEDASSGEEEEEIVRDLLSEGIPKIHIREYVGRYDFL